MFMATVSTIINLSHGMCVIAHPILKIKFPVSHNTPPPPPHTHTHTVTSHQYTMCRNDIGTGVGGVVYDQYLYVIIRYL